jgi:hypothetical protein
MLAPDDFLGLWRLERTIDDRLAGVAGRFEGTARFAPQEGGLLYREEGTLRLGGGAPLAAHRAYLWRWEGGAVAVSFPDGRPFHRFRPEGESMGTDHPCGADLYRVAYDFAAFPRWTAEWQVEGPRKGYRMRSAYAPA